MFAPSSTSNSCGGDLRDSKQSEGPFTSVCAAAAAAGAADSSSDAAARV